MNTLIRNLLRLCAIVLLTGATALEAGQDNILTVRVNQPFTATLDNASAVLEKQGFTVAHVQKCDGGLHQMGYETDHYRVIFFGRLEEVRELSKTHPQLIPLFPFKLAVYADGDDSVLSVINPAGLEAMLPQDAELAAQLQQWETEFKVLLQEVQGTLNQRVAGL